MKRHVFYLMAFMAAATAAFVSCGATCAAQSADVPPGGTPVLAADALLTTPLAGLERTKATAQVVPVTGQTFSRALRVTIGTDAPETNATQLTMTNAAPVEKGDVLLASFYVRGSSASGKSPAQAEFLFEKTTNPWTKSATQGVIARREPSQWRRILVPFASSESYKPGEAMASLRFAFGPQTVEVGGLSVVNYGKTKTPDELIALSAQQNPLGSATVTLRLADTRQTMRGFGGNFVGPRYNSSVPLDAVGRYNLDHLRVVHARVGIPLNHWTPEKGVYREEGPALAALLQMQEIAKRKIPITGSVWEGPLWMLPGTAPEQGQRTLPRERYDDCIEAIARFLATARDKYGVTVDYFSFNEADYGVNFKFSPAQIVEFMRLAGPRFAARGLKTKFLVGDTANGSNFAAYARPILEDKSVAPYLGPLAFHSWDALGAPESSYTAIAALGRQYNKPIWCTEAGHDSQLWQAQNPWPRWDNALRTALAYERTLRLTGASLMEYWTYENNYPLVSQDGKDPFPVWQVIRQMEEAFAPGSRIATATVSHDELKVLPSVGPKAGQFSVLLVNPAGPGKATITGLPRGATLTVQQSSEGALRRTTSMPVRADRTGRLTLTLPARSVVTLRSSSPGVR
jgi:O-glycosyl hydrolase